MTMMMIIVTCGDSLSTRHATGTNPGPFWGCQYIGIIYMGIVNIQAKCSLFCSLLNQNTFGFEVVPHLVLGI